jgi:hypothetical protein
LDSAVIDLAAVDAHDKKQTDEEPDDYAAYKMTFVGDLPRAS